MAGLILFSHGSLLCGAGQELNDHAERLRGTGCWEVVEVGYMNYSEPTFADSVNVIVKAGVHRVTVVPYFLIPGKFVTSDVPRHVEAAKTAHPEIQFQIADPLGFDDSLAEAIIELASNARGSESWRRDLARASEFCLEEPDCPLYGSVRCPPTLSRRQEASM